MSQYNPNNDHWFYVLPYVEFRPCSIPDTEGSKFYIIIQLYNKWVNKTLIKTIDLIYWLMKNLDPSVSGIPLYNIIAQPSLVFILFDPQLDLIPVV